MRGILGARGVSEVLGALILVIVMSAALVVAVNLYKSVGEGLERVSNKVSDKIVDEAYAPLMSLSLENRNLYLVVYPQKPIEISYVVYVTGNSLVARNVSETIDGPVKLLLKSGYDCEPFQAVIITSGGAMIGYSPYRDPRVASAVSADPDIAQKLPAGGFIDACSLMQLASQQASGREGGGDIIVDSETGKAEILLRAGDPQVGVVRGDPSDYTELIVDINGTLYSNHADLQFALYDQSGALLGSATLSVEALSIQAQTAEETLGYIVGEQGQTIAVLARVACSNAACFAGVFFKSLGAPTLYVGTASVYATLSYNTPLSGCPYSQDKLVAPIVLGDVSNYTGYAWVKCRSSLGIYVDMEGRATGSFITDGPLALLYSTSMGVGVNARAAIDLKETVEVDKLSPAQVMLPVSGPIQYWETPLTPEARNGFDSALAAFLGDPEGRAVLRVEYEGFTFSRIITSTPHSLVLGNASYTVELDSKPSLPSLTLPRVTSYTVQPLDSSTTKYTWRLASEIAPFDLLSLIPRLVHIRSIESGEQYLVVLPTTSSILVSQLGRNYTAIAGLIGGVNASIRDPPPSQRSFYLIQLSGNLQGSLKYTYATGVEVQVDPGSGEFSVPSIPGVYVVAAVPSSLDPDPALYESILIITY